MIDSDDVASEAAYESDVFAYLYHGDVVSLCDNNGNAIHTVIITAYGSTGSISDLLYSAHTANRNDYPLYNAIRSYDKARFYNFSE